MHDLGLEPTEGRPQTVGRLCKSTTRPDRPDQFGKNSTFEAKLSGSIEEIPFRPFGRPGDQRHIVVIVMVKVLRPSGACSPGRRR